MWGLRLLSVEGFRFDAGFAKLAANVDLDVGTGPGQLRGHIRHPDAGLEAGRQGPARDDSGFVAVLQDGVSLARDARARQNERGELLFGPGLASRSDGLGADEARVLLATPAQAGLDRVAGLIHVIAVEVEAHLQAQGVTCAKPGRSGTGVEKAGPPGRRAARLQQEFDAVFA